MDAGNDPFAAAIGTAPQRSARAASWPAVAALALASLSVALIVVAGSLAIGLTGYVAAAVLAPALVVVYRATERRAQQHTHFVHQRTPRRVATLAIVVGLLAGTAHAWVIATELAKI